MVEALNPKEVCGALGLTPATLNNWLRPRGSVRNLDAQREETTAGKGRKFSVEDFHALAICAAADRAGLLNRQVGSWARIAIQDMGLKGLKVGGVDPEDIRLLYFVLNFKDGEGWVSNITYNRPDNFVSYLCFNLVGIVSRADEDLDAYRKSVKVREIYLGPEADA